MNKIRTITKAKIKRAAGGNLKGSATINFIVVCQ